MGSQAPQMKNSRNIITESRFRTEVVIARIRCCYAGDCLVPLYYPLPVCQSARRPGGKIGTLRTFGKVPQRLLPMTDRV